MAKKRRRYKKYYYGDGLYIVDKQKGRSNLKRDRKRRALLPGKRISKNGKIYYEYRKNRSDLRGDYPTKKRKKK